MVLALDRQKVKNLFNLIPALAELNENIRRSEIPHEAINRFDVTVWDI